MSDMMELAYTLLLGWISALTDWLWALISGGGGGNFFGWLLEHWKAWLAVLVLGGLVADWLIHMLRWQPYKVWLRRPVSETSVPVPEQQWDESDGYYEESETEEAQEWTDLTLPLLSEIDENWAQTSPFTPVEETDASMAPTRMDFAAAQPYLEEDEEPFRREEGFYFEEEEPQEENTVRWEIPENMPDESWETLQPSPDLPQENCADTDIPSDPSAVQSESFEEEVTMVYGSRGFWPGQGIFAAEMKSSQENKAETDPEPAQAPSETMDASTAEEETEAFALPQQAQETDAAPSTGRRRRRGIRQSERNESPAYYTPPKAAPSMEIPRETVVVPQRQERLFQENSNVVQTVTGRPAVRRGLMRFTMANEEPIAGLPPMRVEGGGFHPAARPENPDEEMDIPAEEWND